MANGTSRTNGRKARGTVQARQRSAGGAGQQASTPPQAQPQPTPQAQPAQPVPPAPTPALPPAPMQTSLRQLSQMNDQQVANILKKAENIDLPNHLKDRYDPTQNLIYTIGLNAPPQVMDKQAFDSFRKANNIPSSQIMARMVGQGTYNTTSGNRRRLTPQQVAQMWTSDPYNYIGGKHGGQALGAGAYFDMNGGKATGYASGGALTVAVLNPQTARVITQGTLMQQARQWANSHPQANRQLQKMAGKSQASFGNAQLSLYAAVLGYNVITDGTGYYNVIDRSAVVVRQ